LSRRSHNARTNTSAWTASRSPIGELSHLLGSQRRVRAARGRGAELLMATVGRTSVLDALDGPGLPLLRQRISG
jgi:hypothetical protein